MSSTSGTVSAVPATFLLLRINSLNCVFGTMRSEDIYMYILLQMCEHDTGNREANKVIKYNGAKQ